MVRAALGLCGLDQGGHDREGMQALGMIRLLLLGHLLSCLASILLVPRVEPALIMMALILAWVPSSACALSSVGPHDGPSLVGASS